MDMVTERTTKYRELLIPPKVAPPEPDRSLMQDIPLMITLEQRDILATTAMTPSLALHPIFHQGR
jgi:hypothetical protein